MLWTLILHSFRSATQIHFSQTIRTSRNQSATGAQQGSPPRKWRVRDTRAKMSPAGTTEPDVILTNEAWRKKQKFLRLPHRPLSVFPFLRDKPFFVPPCLCGGFCLSHFLQN